MSGKLWKMSLLAVLMLAVLAFAGVFLYQKRTTPEKEQNGVELVRTEQTEPQTAYQEEAKEELEEVNTAPEAYEYILVDHHNYVAVYRLPERTIYEYTDVIMDVLPEETRKEIRNGKYLKDEEELYNFLENYTS